MRFAWIRISLSGLLPLIASVASPQTQPPAEHALGDQPVVEQPRSAEGPSAEAPLAAPRPAPASRPDGPLGEVIALGERLVEETVTHPLTKDYVGNALNCTSCHLQNGRHPQAASLTGVAAAYPAWSAREQRVITLEDRVLNCFMRSCNGIRPPLGSQPSVAITAYITWLSTEYPLRMNARRPNGPHAIRALPENVTQPSLSRGEQLYARRCSACHGSDGQGIDGQPPVWGHRSYNQGAGLANPRQLAAWLKVAMPLDDADLTDQEALDIAAFVNSHQRPEFQLLHHLPPANRLGEYNSAETPPSSGP